MTRSFGTKKQTLASKRAAAMQYLVLKETPSAEQIVRLFGLTAAEAQRMVEDERVRRAYGSASSELRRAFNG